MLETIRTNTILYCLGFKEAVLFYRDKLGLSVKVEKDWFVEFRLTENSFLSIADAMKSTIDAVGGQGIKLA
jgi:hypothetical protein